MPNALPIELFHCDPHFIWSRMTIENGSVQIQERNRRNNKSDKNNEAAEVIDLHVSTRKLSRDFGISKTSILKMLKKYTNTIYHYTTNFTIIISRLDELNLVNGHLLKFD